MLRLRLISLALTSGLALSGCCSTCETGSMFPRMSERFSARPAIMASAPSGIMEGADCGCQQSAWPQGMPMPVGQGPFLMPGSVTNPSPVPAPPPPPTITTVPTTQPAPPLFRVPTAPPTAYNPTN